MRVNEMTKSTINYLTNDSSKLRHLITRRSPTTETQQPIDRKWSVKPILRSIQIYAGIALRFDRKSDLRRAMKPGPDIHEDRRGSVVVSTSAWHAAGRGSVPGPGTLLGVKTGSLH